TGCKTPGAAADLIRFLLSDAEVAAISDATGLIPVTEGRADLSQYYHRSGPRRIFYDYVKTYGKRRPETPAFPFISSIFFKTTRNLRDGQNARDALDDAVDAIEPNIRDNRGFGFPLKLSERGGSE
ncbi:MAG: sugar ABC transporter substrate-binding protein, partial [Pseudomonadota bacterium]